MISQFPIYVAGGFPDRHFIRELCEKLRAMGIVQTCNWWEHEITGDDVESKYADDDVAGVRSAKLFAIYHTGKCTAGKYFEMGIAHERNMPILVLGKPLTTVFRRFASHTFVSDDLVFLVDSIVQYVKEIGMGLVS